MGSASKIEWTDSSWNPIRARFYTDEHAQPRIGWHCEHVSEGCRNCYAEAMNRRLGTGLEFKPGLKPEIFLDEKMLIAPLRWNRSRRIFVGSMSDLFADFVPDEMIDSVFRITGQCDDLGIRHIFQILTKRPERQRAYMLSDRARDAWNRPRMAPQAWPPRNIWLGTSCEDQETADARIPDLLETPAAVRFISAEPLLASVDLAKHLGIAANHEDLHGLLNWVIVGGESGPHARPMHPYWPRAIRDQCLAAGVPFFFKQWGTFRLSDLRLSRKYLYAVNLNGRVEKAPEIFSDGEVIMERASKHRAGRLLDGIEHNAYPEARR